MTGSPVEKIELAGIPPLLSEIFVRLEEAGAVLYALFGGAVRDADYSARHGTEHPIKDYDLRIWLPAENLERETQILIPALEETLETTVRLTPSAGTGRIRYCFDFAGSELDISIRPVPQAWGRGPIPISAVAQDRAYDSDIGICAVAIDPAGQAWARLEYLKNQTNQTISVYFIADPEREIAYTRRIQKKFPTHRIIRAGEQVKDEAHDRDARAPDTRRTPGMA